ncbi:MAG: cytochrome-c peroxidase, partial [Granulosicoccus sp.]
MGESDLIEDAYRFRTPALRNVELTGPFGHNGAFDSLEGIIRHHLNPRSSFDQWQPHDARLPAVPWLKSNDFVIRADLREMQRVRSKIDITPVQLSDKEVNELVSFMSALTGTTAEQLPLGIPEQVPSGLALD